MKLYTISKHDGKKDPKANIVERLKTEVGSGYYDFIIIEVGVNEISNFIKKKYNNNNNRTNNNNNNNTNTTEFEERIEERIIELSMVIKDIQREKSDLKFVILNQLPRIDSKLAVQYSKVLDRSMNFEFQEHTNVWVKSLQFDVNMSKDQVTTQ